MLSVVVVGDLKNWNSSILFICFICLKIFI